MLSFKKMGLLVAISSTCLIWSGMANAFGVSTFATCGAQMLGWEAMGALGTGNALFSSSPTSSNLATKGANIAGDFGGQGIKSVATRFAGFVKNHPRMAKMAQGLGSALIFHDARALKDMIIYAKHPGFSFHSIRFIVRHHGKVELRKFMRYLSERNVDLTRNQVIRRLLVFNSTGKRCLRSSLSWGELAKSLNIDVTGGQAASAPRSQSASVR